MIQIIKEGRAAFRPGTAPGEECPYTEHMSVDQLCWLLGWYKAATYHLQADLGDIKANKIDCIDMQMFKAKRKGEDDYNSTGIFLCPFKGSTLLASYDEGWRKAKAHHDAINRNRAADDQVSRGELCSV